MILELAGAGTANELVYMQRDSSDRINQVQLERSADHAANAHVSTRGILDQEDLEDPRGRITESRDSRSIGSREIRSAR